MLIAYALVMKLKPMVAYKAQAFPAALLLHATPGAPKCLDKVLIELSLSFAKVVLVIAGRVLRLLTFYLNCLTTHFFKYRMYQLCTLMPSDDPLPSPQKLSPNIWSFTGNHYFSVRMQFGLYFGNIVIIKSQ